MTLADEDYLSKVLVEVNIEESVDDSSVTTADSLAAAWQEHFSSLATDCHST